MPNDSGESSLPRPAAAVLAVPAEVIDELEAAGLARRAPVFRGPAADAVMTVGTDAATLVTLLQTPQIVQAFAAWIVERAKGRRERITIVGRRGDRAVRLVVDGDVPPEVVARFVASALGGSEGN